MTAERRQILQERLEKKIALLDKLYDALDNFDGIESYKFQSAEAIQQTKYRNIKDIQDQITIIEAQINRINRLLNGTGLNNIILRRRGYCGYC